MTASPGVYAILCSCKERLCQESTLRGLRREVRFIMSPPGKRRHNELNAAPPPETPRRTGKPGETNNRDVVHSGESFCIRGEICFLGEPRGTTRLSLPLKGEGYSVRGRTFNSPRSDAVGQPLPPGWTLSDIHAAGKMHNHRSEMNFKPSKTALALFKVLKIQFTICATHTKLCEMPKQGLLFRF